MNRIPPDEHLRQALRHAPDADVAPPDDISAQILAAAHRSAASLPPRAPRTGSAGWRWVAALWHRPGASAALASVMLAGFIGLLWRGEVPGAAREEAPAAPAPAPAPTADAGRAVESLRAVLPAVAPQVEPAARRAVPGARLPAAKVLPEKAAAATPPADATRRAAGNEGRAPGPVLHTQPAEIAPVQPDPPAGTPPAARAEPRNVDPRTPEAQAPTSPARVAPAPPPLSAAPESRQAQRDAVASPAAADAGAGAPWQTSFTSGAQWLWQPEGPLRDPDGPWWAALARATQGHWRQAADDQAAAGSVRLVGRRGADRVGQLWLEPAAVLWCGTVPPCQRAALPAESRRALLDRLAR